MNFLRRVLAVMRKDVRAEWRTRERLSPMLFFVLLVLLVFNFSFDLGGAALHEIGPGVMWSSFVFAAVLALNRSFADEQENGCLDALLLAPGDRGAIYAGKMLGNLVFLLTLELLVLPLFALFFNLSPGLHLLALVPILVLGAASLAAAGTLFAAMSSNLRLRELLLPLLLLPMVVPALIACVEGTALVLQERPLAEMLPYLKILIAYVTVFVTLSLLLFEHVVEE
ncbi:MAG: heme exporter protein CcmB [Candidatus Latescibacterota bacterium]|jgi:heme exporter protein B